MFDFHAVCEEEKKLPFLFFLMHAYPSMYFYTLYNIPISSNNLNEMSLIFLLLLVLYRT